MNNDALRSACAIAVASLAALLTIGLLMVAVHYGDVQRTSPAQIIPAAAVEALFEHPDARSMQQWHERYPLLATAHVQDAPVALALVRTTDGVLTSVIIDDVQRSDSAIRIGPFFVTTSDEEVRAAMHSTTAATSFAETDIYRYVRQHVPVDEPISIIKLAQPANDIGDSHTLLSRYVRSDHAYAALFLHENTQTVWLTGSTLPPVMQDAPMPVAATENAICTTDVQEGWNRLRTSYPAESRTAAEGILHGYWHELLRGDISMRYDLAPLGTDGVCMHWSGTGVVMLGTAHNDNDATEARSRIADALHARSAPLTLEERSFDEGAFTFRALRIAPGNDAIQETSATGWQLRRWSTATLPAWILGQRANRTILSNDERLSHVVLQADGTEPDTAESLLRGRIRARGYLAAEESRRMLNALGIAAPTQRGPVLIEIEQGKQGEKMTLRAISARNPSQPLDSGD